MRDEHRGDRAVVLEQIRLRDPLVRPEDLVRVAQLDARLDLLAVDVDSGLVVAQPLKRWRTQMPVVRELRELDLRDELRLHPHDVRLLHARHLRHDRER